MTITTVAHRSWWWMVAWSMCVCCPLWSQYNVSTIQKVVDKYDDWGENFQVVINPMVEDSLGYIWIGGKKGLCRYSGSTVQCFRHIEGDPSSIRSNDIENVFLDGDHHIWLAIRGKGLDVVNIQGEKIKEFRYEANNPNSLLANRVWGMFEDRDGYLWISYFSGGLSRYDKNSNRFEHFSIDSKEFLQSERPKTVVKAIPHSTEDHTYWLSTTRGLVKFNTRSQEYDHFMFYSPIAKGLAESYINDDVLHSVWNRDMIMDSEGILWLGNFGGIVRFDPEDNSYQVLYYNEGEFTKDCVGLFEVNTDQILASVRSGLVLIDKESLAVTTLKDTNGFGPDFDLQNRFYESRNGCLYLISAANESGIHQICKDFQYVENRDNDVFLESIVASDSYLYYFNGKGILIEKDLKTEKIREIKLRDERVFSIKYMTHSGNDTMWIATFNELYRYHPSSGLELYSDLVIENSYRFESLLIDREGDVWSGRQRDGIYRHKQDTDKVLHYNQKSSPALVYQDYIRSMTQDSEGHIWISTEDGWTIFDKKTETTKNYSSDDIASRFGVDVKEVTDIVEAPNGKFYISDNAYGILIWNKQNEEVVGTLGKEEGLNSGVIYDLHLDGHLIWVSEKGGLSVLDTRTQSVKGFGAEYGILNNTHYSTTDRFGKVYAAHKSGYYELDKEGLLMLEDQTPEVVLNSFRIYQTPADSLVLGSNRIVLDYNENFFTFGFGSINYHNPWEERYQYQLKGVDKTWVDAKGGRTKGYTDIRPGTYSFKVRVKTRGDWSSPIEKVIRIKPAWYQTWWFRLLLAAAILTILYFWVENYIQNRKKEIEYEKRFAQLETMILKSQMNPHFIFNSLNSIRYLFMVDKKEKGLLYITKFAKLLRTTLHHGEQALINLVDEIELTELFIQLEQLRFDEEFNFEGRYESEGNWKHLQIPPFVIQPIVENAFWHGLSQSTKAEKNIKIHIIKEGPSWWIHVDDNGVGISNTSSQEDSAVNKKKSFGLNIIRERFELINKTENTRYALLVSDHVGETGTRVSIKITPKP